MSRGRRQRKATPAGGETSGHPGGDERSLYHTVRLRLLYDIGKLLTGFESVERTVPPVLALLHETLPIRTAVFVRQEPGREPRALGWVAEGEREDRLPAAVTHALEAFAYFVEGGAAPPGKEDFLLLPLLIAGQPTFGALQVEGSGPLDEPDLIFLNAVALELAIAVDRQAAVLARQETTEAREREQRLFASVGAVVGATLGYRECLEALAHSVVPQFADLCLVDEVGEDGVLRRMEVATGDTGEVALVDRLRRAAPQAGPHTVRATALASRRPVLLDRITDPFAQGVAGKEEADLLRVAGVGSMLVVPLVARGHSLGVLAFATTGSRRSYETRDLAIAEELARRAALAVDNARLYEQAQRATLARDNLLAIVSHDLKNPLSVILANLAVLLRRPEAEDRRRSRRQLVAVQRSADRMNRMIADLLDTASIAAGRLSVERRPLDVAPLLSDTIEAMQPLAATKSLRLGTELPDASPAVLVDGARLQQALINLLGNAIKFTAEGGSVVVGARPAGGELTIWVQDTGPGIAEEELPHVFDRFWQAAPTARLGSGLGLFIVKGIAEAHGGRVWVESRVGEGTTFFLAIPTAAPAPLPIGPAGEPADDHRPAGS